MTNVKIVMAHSIEDNPEKCMDCLHTSAPVSSLKNTIETYSSFDKWCLDDLCRFISGLPVNSIDVLILTFDDGYKTFMSEVLPMAEQYKVPVAVFITSDFINGILPYEMSLANLIENTDVLILPRGEIILSFENRMSVYTDIKTHIKRKSPEERKISFDKILSLNKYFAVPEINDMFMSWKDLRSIKSHPLVTIGSHGVSHCLLKYQSHNTILYELTRSKMELEKQLKIGIKYLSYPHGSHSDIVCDLAYKTGYALAFKARKNRTPFNSAVNRYAIPRDSI